MINGVEDRQLESKIQDSRDFLVFFGLQVILEKV